MAERSEWEMKWEEYCKAREEGLEILKSLGETENQVKYDRYSSIITLLFTTSRNNSSYIVHYEF